MIFKGKNWRRARRVVVLPGSDNYLLFGRACARDTSNAVKTDYNWKGDSPFGDPVEGEKSPVYARPVKVKGHSLTNLMYGADDYMYLCLDGLTYVRRAPKPRNGGGR